MSQCKEFVGLFEILEIADKETRSKILSDNEFLRIENDSFVPCPIHDLEGKCSINVNVTTDGSVDSGLFKQISLANCTCEGNFTPIFPIFPKEIKKIGRDARMCDIVINHAATSSVHLIVWSVRFDSDTPPMVYLNDVSRNGVYLNQKLVGKGNTVILRDYDTIEIKRAIKLMFRKLSHPAEAVHIPLKINKIQDWVISNDIIGSGSYGSVYVAHKKDNVKNYAVKIIKNVGGQFFLSKDKEKFKNEANILMRINHPNIINVHEAILMENSLYIFEDLVCGGDLFSYIVKGNSLKPISEDEVIVIIFQLLKALDYLHNKLNVIHRDLKLDNVLLEAPVPCSKIYLCDFGIAKSLKTLSQRTQTIVGTVEYSAPEVFKGPPSIDVNQENVRQASKKLCGSSKSAENQSTVAFETSFSSPGYDFRCDMWSLGIMMHIMLSGVSPFFSNGENENIIKNARIGKINLERTCFAKTSPPAKDFIKNLIQVNPIKRLTVIDCFRHSWISKNRKSLDRIYKERILHNK